MRKFNGERGPWKGKIQLAEEGGGSEEEKEDMRLANAGSESRKRGGERQAESGGCSCLFSSGIVWIGGNWFWI